MIITIEQVWGGGGGRGGRGKAINCYSKEKKKNPKHDLSDSFRLAVDTKFSIHVGFFGCFVVMVLF